MVLNGTTRQNNLYRILYNRTNASIERKDTEDIENNCYYICDVFVAGNKITVEQGDELTGIMDAYMETVNKETVTEESTENTTE